MLLYDVAKSTYLEIKAAVIAADDPLDRYADMYERLLKSAVSYAETRAEWAFMNRADRAEFDRGRTIKHDAFMSNLTALCDALHIKYIDTLMPDRKDKGDFACYIALFLSIEQR